MEYIVNLNLSEYLLLFQILGVYLGVEFQTHPIMNIKRNIIFALESRKKNGVPIVENVPIRMRVIYASQRIEFTTGYRIDVAKWDSDKQRVKNGCTNKLKVGSINSIFYFLHKAAEPFNCLEQGNLA